MIISLIAALTTVDYVIGMRNTIPWHLPADMQWFKYHTSNKPIIMGRKTFESIGKKPLKNRLNIVISRFLTNDYTDVYVVKNINRALYLVKYCHEVMVIGGGELYNIFLPQSQRLYLTYIDTTFYIYGDAWFPLYNIKEWKSLFNKSCNVIKKSDCYNLSFNIFERL